MVPLVLGYAVGARSSRGRRISTGAVPYYGPSAKGSAVMPMSGSPRPNGGSPWCVFILPSRRARSVEVIRWVGSLILAVAILYGVIVVVVVVVDVELGGPLGRAPGCVPVRSLC